MPKERSINPAAAQRKADKAKSIKKGKAETATRRTEKLARRNPERLQKQLDELAELEAAGQLTRPKDKQTLEQLRKDLKAVRRARETLGDKAPEFRGGAAGGRREGEGDRRRDGGGGEHLGKRRRGNDDAYARHGGDGGAESSETDADVRDIPMPRDTPPPVPRQARRVDGRGHRGQERGTAGASGQGGVDDDAPPTRPAAQVQTTYSSAPVMRNLAKEARRFLPAAVAQNLARQKGEGGRLLEPEELDRLEKAGYGDASKAADEAEKEAQFAIMAAEARSGGQRAVRAADDEDRIIERELLRVEMEEVPDEDL